MTVAVDLFESIRRTENSRLENQKQAITILKATEETLSEQGLPLEPESYFKVLFPLLDDEARERALKTEDRVIELNSAVIYLLSFVFPRLNDSFLRAHYSQIYATLSHALIRFKLVAPFVRSALVALKFTMLAHRDMDWFGDQSSLGELFAQLLELATDERPKVRRMAQEAAVALASVQAQARDSLLEFISSVIMSTARKSLGHTLHLLPLSRILASKPGSGMDDAARANSLVSGLLHCIDLSDNILSAAVYQAIEGLSNAAFEALSGLDSVSLAELSSSWGPVYGAFKRLLEGVMKKLPVTLSPEVIGPFLTSQSALAQCIIKIQGLLSKNEAASEIACKSAQVSAHYFGQDSVPESIWSSAVSGLSSLLASLLGESSADLVDEKLLGSVFEVVLAMVPNSSQLRQSPLAERRLEMALPLLAGIFESLGNRATSEEAKPLILHLVKLHDYRQLNCREGVLKAVGAAIRAAGLRSFLTAVPLNLPNGPSARPWLVPVIEASIYNTSLQAFHDLVWPVVKDLEAKAEHLNAENRASEARMYSILRDQVVSILPAAIASFPTDFADAFPSLAETVGRLLNDDPQARPAFASCFIKLVQNCRTLIGDADVQLTPNAPSLDDEDASDKESVQMPALPSQEVFLVRPLTPLQAERDLNTLRKLIPQYLPILFNVYAAESAAGTAPAYLLNTVEIFLQMSPPDAVADYFVRTTQRISGSITNPTPALLTVLELAACLASAVDVEACGPALAALMESLLGTLSGSGDHALEKRVYRLLLVLVGREDVLHYLHIHEEGKMFGQLLSALIESSCASHSASKKLRFRLISLLSQSWPDAFLGSVSALIPEVILGVKESNGATRDAAYGLLVSFGRRMNQGGSFLLEGTDGSEVRTASLSEYLNMMVAGLAGTSSQMVSATIMALARVVFEFAGVMKRADVVETGELNVMRDLASDIISLLEVPSREIVSAAISFVKVMVTVYGTDQEFIASLLPSLVKSLLEGAGHSRHNGHFKRPIRHFVVRLVRRFGVEELQKHIPDEHQPLLSHIRKEQGRASRRSAQNTTVEEDGDAEPSQRLLNMNRRFDRAVANEDDDDFELDASDAEDAAKQGRRSKADQELSVAMSRQLSLATLASKKGKIRLPNLSRKQQVRLEEELKQKQHAMQAQKKRRQAESESEDDDLDVQFDGKLIVKGRAEDKAVADAERNYQAAMSSFKRSADGKHVKFARGTKTIEFENDEEEEEEDNVGMSTRLDKASIAAGSTKSRHTSLTALSRKSKLSSAAVSTGLHSGSQYRPAKKGARGDAKRKDAKFDPYAYLPIQRKQKGKGQAGAKERYFMNSSKKAKHS